jgi:hypothetical protein
VLGPYTKISAIQYKSINWTTFKTATRDISVAVFGKETMATHSLTGLSSNSNQKKIAKPALDPNKVNDIIGN